jgi:hypothetical protein
MAADRYLSRAVLERFLGGGRFTIVDRSGAGRERFFVWDCGCRAREEDEDAFKLCPCLAHYGLRKIFGSALPPSHSRS